MQPGLKTEKDNIFDPQTDEGRAAVKKLLPNLTAEQGAKYLKQFEQIDYGQVRLPRRRGEVRPRDRPEDPRVAQRSTKTTTAGAGGASSPRPTRSSAGSAATASRTTPSSASRSPRCARTSSPILKELLDGYAIDGLFLDWIRTGDIRDNPQNDPKTGVANYGYETPNVEALQAAARQVDPHDVAADDDAWAAVRAEGATQFMRDARKLVASHARKVPVCAMVGHPWHYRGTVDRIAGNLKGLLLDVKTWADEGLVDSVIAAGYYRDGGTPEMAYKALKEETGGKVDVWTYAWVPQNVAEFDRDFALAKSLGAKQILFWEADYIDDRPNARRAEARR